VVSDRQGGDGPGLVIGQLHSNGPAEAPERQHLSLEVIASHVAMHLQSIMRLTLRIISIDGVVGVSSECQSASGSTDCNLSWLFSNQNNLDREMDTEMGTSLYENGHDIPLSGYIIPIPESYVDWENVPRNAEVPVEKDKFFEEVIKSGAFQPHQTQPDMPPSPLSTMIPIRRDHNFVPGGDFLLFDHIHAERRSAADLLSLMSFFDPGGIPRLILQPDGLPKSQSNSQAVARNRDDDNEVENTEILGAAFEEDMAMLLHFDLVEQNDQENIFIMQGLLQSSIRNWLDAKGELEYVKRQYIARMAKTFPIAEFANWEECRKLFAHVLTVEANPPQDNVSLNLWASLLHNGAWYAFTQGYYVEAVRVAETAIATRQKVLGVRHPETLSSMSSLALTYRNQGRWEEADVLGKRVIEMRIAVLGEQHPNTLNSMNNLAPMYQQRGRWQEAEELLKQVIGMMKKVHGEQHPHTLSSNNNLALIY
jgi:hypothetical protein